MLAYMNRSILIATFSFFLTHKINSLRVHHSLQTAFSTFYIKVNVLVCIVTA